MASAEMAQAILGTARLGANSVFEYIERTAEIVPDGVRWQTLNYYNEPYYDTGLYTGVAGISLFLSDYYRLTGNTTARDLAAGALRWCIAPERAPGVDPQRIPLPLSLYSGASGLGLAWLRLALATGDAGALRQATALAEGVIAAEPGPWTEFGRGATGEGLFLVRLWEASGEERHLRGAVARGRWLRDHVIRDERGSHWLRVLDVNNPKSRARAGFHVGSAGIGYFLLALYEATQDVEWAMLSREAADTLVRLAQPDRGGLNWPYATRGQGSTKLASCQWCLGAPGNGYFLAKAAAVLGESAYLATAKAAGETTYAYGDVRSNASQCHGLAGSAELFLALYRLTGEQVWLGRAHDFAVQALGYRMSTPAGDVWRADDPGCYSPDFFCGAAGVGHFFLRLQAPDQLELPFA